MHRLERSGLGSVGTWTEAEIGCVKSMHRLKGVPSVESRGPPRRVSAYEISKSTGFQVDFGFQNGFRISKWISRFSNLDAVFTEIRIFPCYRIHFNPYCCMPTA